MPGLAQWITDYRAVRLAAWLTMVVGLPLTLLAQGQQGELVLEQHGTMKLQYVSIHGPAPLILLLTEAPGASTQAERNYRTRFTDLLTQYIAMHGFSYFVFRDSLGEGRGASTPEATLDRLEVAAREVTAALWKKQVPPAAYVGLAEGAVVAARLVQLDSMPRRLIALAPSLPDQARKGPPRWDEVIQALYNGLPLLLAVQSMCDGPMPEALNRAGLRPQRLLLLPNYDTWLATGQGASCSDERKAMGSLPSLNVAQMVAEWLSSSVPFPQ